MYIRARSAKSWRELAAEVAQEDNPEKLAELTDKLLGALEEEKRLADARLHPATKTPQRPKPAGYTSPSR